MGGGYYKDSEGHRLLLRGICSLLLCCPLLYVTMAVPLLQAPLPLRFEKDRVGLGICELLVVMVIFLINRRIFQEGLGDIRRKLPSVSTAAVFGSWASFGLSVNQLLVMSMAQAEGREGVLRAAQEELCFDAAGLMLTIVVLLRAIENAASKRAGHRRIFTATDKVTRIFVPFVLVSAILTVVLGILAGREPERAVWYAVTVLCVGVPCTAGVAIPLGLMEGGRIGEKHGIRYRSAPIIKTFAEVEHAILDKTGVVTEGAPRVTDVLPNETVGVPVLLAAAGMLESQMHSPLAEAVMKHIADNGESYTEADRFQKLSGSKAAAYYNGSMYYAGGQVFIYEMLRETDGEEDFVDFVRTWKIERYEKDGKTPLFFAQDTKLLGALMVADPLRPEAAGAIRRLKALGVNVLLFSDDEERVATAIGKSVGVETVIAGTTQRVKQRIVFRLKRRFGNTMAVGDGVHDTVVTEAANFGVVIHGKEPINEKKIMADILTRNRDLMDVPRAVVLARSIRRRARQNLVIGSIYQLLAISLSAGLWEPFLGIAIPPVGGAALMGGYALLVIANVKRLTFVNLDRIRPYARPRKKVSYGRIIFTSLEKEK